MENFKRIGLKELALQTQKNPSQKYWKDYVIEVDDVEGRIILDLYFENCSFRGTLGDSYFSECHFEGCSFQNWHETPHASKNKYLQCNFLHLDIFGDFKSARRKADWVFRGCKASTVFGHHVQKLAAKHPGLASQTIVWDARDHSYLLYQYSSHADVLATVLEAARKGFDVLYTSFSGKEKLMKAKTTS